MIEGGVWRAPVEEPLDLFLRWRRHFDLNQLFFCEKRQKKGVPTHRFLGQSTDDQRFPRKKSENRTGQSADSPK